MRTRSLLVGVLGLAACFKSGGGGTSTTPTPPSNQAPAVDYSATLADPIGFMPIDSEIVLSLDADQLRKSSVWSLFQPKLTAAAGPKLAAFQAACGFDPVASVRGITLGMKNLGADQPDGVMVVTGIDRARMMDCMTKARDRGDQTITIGANRVAIRATGTPGRSSSRSSTDRRPSA